MGGGDWYERVMLIGDVWNGRMGILENEFLLLLLKIALEMNETVWQKKIIRIKIILYMEKQLQRIHNTVSNKRRRKKKSSYFGKRLLASFRTSTAVGIIIVVKKGALVLRPCDLWY